MNKRSELKLKALLRIHDPDIVALTEVKPKCFRYAIQESEISLEGYEPPFHNLDKQGRGIALYVKPELKASINEHLTSEFHESIFVDCKIKDNETLTLGLIYRSPNSSDENSDKLNELIRKAAKPKNHNLLILGDFNFPDIRWENDMCAHGPNHPASKFLETCKDSFLIQHQTEFTHFRADQTPSLVDLVLTSRQDLINEVSTQAALGKSDHATLLIQLSYHKKSTSFKSRYNYSKADIEPLVNELSNVKWEDELIGKSTNDMWKIIKDNILHAVNHHVPKTKSKGVSTKKWMTKEALSSVRNKHKLFRRWLQTRDKTDYQNYLKARNRARKDCRKAQNLMEKKVAAQAKENPKAFWSYVSGKTKKRSGVADLKKDDGSKTKSDEEKAEVLNAFFQSVFTKEGEDELPPPPIFKFDNELNDINIQIDKVEKLLHDLHTGKACGPDGLHPLILSKASVALAKPITMLFRQSLEEGVIPEDWRQANVTPVFKKGSKLSANNYRPVSLTCILCKVMEKVVREVIVSHLEENSLINARQHGFVSGKSCTTQLLEVLDQWTKILDEGGSIDAIYMDFQKAFDSVPYKRLLEKVKAHGIVGKVLRWITSFLNQRRQRVIVNESQSLDAKVTSGIPQGSVLGPILFVIYINDLPNCVANHVQLFADDTKVYTRSDVDGATASLQHDLDNLDKWSKEWLLRFHPQKCHVLKLGFKKSETTYYMNSKDDTGAEVPLPLTESQVEKDLGIYIDSKLCFKEHVSQSTTKANRIVGVIRRSFDYLTNETFVQLFKSLVRPILEYGHSVWEPYNKSLCKEIEQVQKRATKLLGRISDKPYPERLRILKLPSLEFRRKRGDMIVVYKYMHDIFKTDRPMFELYKGRALRGHTLKLEKGHHRLQVRVNFFSQRVINEWNNLPNHVVNAPSMNHFKSSLDAHWAQHPSKYNPECLM